MESGTIFPMTLHAPTLEPARRLRRDEFTRNLVRENSLNAHDLIYPSLWWTASNVAKP